MHADQITSVIEFARHLQTRFEHDFSDFTENFPNIQPYTSILPFTYAKLDKTQRTTIRLHAVTIWNLCNVNTEPTDAKNHLALAKIRAFAFLLLASIVLRRKKNEVDKLLENALVAAKDCLRANVIDLAAQVLDSAMPSVSSNSDRHGDVMDRSSNAKVAEYYALKLYLDWNEERADLAEHWYSRIELTFLESDQNTSESIVDLLLGIGTDCLSKQNFIDASKWLERAQNILEQGKNAIIFAGSDIRIHVLHRMVQALNGITNTSMNGSGLGNLKRAGDILAQLRKEAGSKLSVLLLSLETRLSQIGCDADLAVNDLMEIIRTAHIIEGTHGSIIYYTKQLWSVRPQASADCFRFYIVHRLIPQGDTELVEKAITNYLEFFLDQDVNKTSENLRQLEADFSSFEHSLDGPIGSIAAQAAHVIIWKRLCSKDHATSQSVAMLLCQLGMHSLLLSAAEGSRAKFERQLVSYHLLVTNHAAATDILDNMTLKAKNNKHSRFLSYCLAVRSGNEAEAQSDLNAVLNGSGENSQLLYACLGESVKHNRHCDTALVLQRLIDQQLQTGKSDEIQDLLKFAVLTLIQICESQQPTAAVQDEFQGRLCAIFRSATQFQERLHKELKSKPKGGKLDWKWFSEQSFDIARRHMKLWPKKCTIDLLHYSNQIMQAEMGGLAEAMLSSYQRQRLFDCDYMRIILYAAEGREVTDKYSAEDLPRTSYTSRSKLGSSDYRHVLHKQVFDIYGALLKRQQASIVMEDNEKQESSARLHILMPLAFEASLYMNATAYKSGEAMFDELSPRQFLQAAHELKATAVTFALLADIVLTFASGDHPARARHNDLRIPSLAAAKLLGQIVSTLRESKSYDLDQAARWIRCVVQLVLDDIGKALASNAQPKKPKCEQGLTMLGSLVEQVCELASAIPGDIMSDEVETSMYPSDELQWLASKLFNLAVDLYMSEKKELAQKWASRALRVAEVMCKVCGTVAAKQLIALIQQKMRAMKLNMRSE